MLQKASSNSSALKKVVEHLTITSTNTEDSIIYSDIVNSLVVYTITNSTDIADIYRTVSRLKSAIVLGQYLKKRSTFAETLYLIEIKSTKAYQPSTQDVKEL